MALFSTYLFEKLLVGMNAIVLKGWYLQNPSDATKKDVLIIKGGLNIFLNKNVHIRALPCQDIIGSKNKRSLLFWEDLIIYDLLYNKTKMLSANRPVAEHRSSGGRAYPKDCKSTNSIFFINNAQSIV